jgi:hypothetical protein
MESRVSYYDTAGELRTKLSNGPKRQPEAVRYRTIAAPTGTGSIAVLAAPHQYFFPRDFTTNMRYGWHSSWKGRWRWASGNCRTMPLRTIRGRMRRRAQVTSRTERNGETTCSRESQPGWVVYAMFRGGDNRNRMGRNGDLCSGPDSGHIQFNFNVPEGTLGSRASTNLYGDPTDCHFRERLPVGRNLL